MSSSVHTEDLWLTTKEAASTQSIPLQLVYKPRPFGPQTFLRTSSSSSVRRQPASLSRGLVSGEGCRPSGLWPGVSVCFCPLSRPWDAPEESDRRGLLDALPERECKRTVSGKCFLYSQYFLRLRLGCMQIGRRNIKQGIKWSVATANYNNLLEACDDLKISNCMNLASRVW